MHELSCSDCLDLCADVALGIADAKDRADVLSHVERCTSCRSQLRSLTEVADGLTALVPPVPPPPGFEGRVLNAISTATASSPTSTFFARVRARPLAVAAAVVAAAAIGVGGWTLGRTTSAPSSTVVTASLWVKHTPVGEVMVVPGDPPWISMAVHLSVGDMVVRCEVRDEDGVLTTVGTFTIRRGYGYWAASLPYGLVVREAELVTPDGRVLAAGTVGD
jgi:hypothetical protein